MKNKHIIIIVVVAIILILLGIVLIFASKSNTSDNSNNVKKDSENLISTNAEDYSNLPKKNTTAVKDEKTEEVIYEGIRIVGTYKNHVMNIKLGNTTKENYLITSITMKTFKDDKEVKTHKFDINQVLESGHETTTSFVERIEDFDKIEFSITKEKTN